MYCVYPKKKGCMILKAIHRIVAFIEKFVTLYMGIASFVIMFTVFIAGVFWRYVLRSPITWSMEVCLTSYIWMVMFSACYTSKEHGHVVFTLIYEKFSLKVRAVISILGNLLVTAAFALTLEPTISYILSMKRQETSILKVGLDIVYSPYLLFLVMTIIYLLIETYKDFLILLGRANMDTINEFIEKGEATYEKEIQNYTKEDHHR